MPSINLTNMSAQDVLLKIIRSVPAVSRATDPPRLRSPSTETVTVYIGTNSPWKITLPKDLVCAASKVFRVAFQKGTDGAGFAESQTNEMKFPEECGQALGALADWLCNQFPGTSAKDCRNMLVEDMESWHRYWFEVFLFADRIMAPGLQLYAWEQIKHIFNATKPVKPSRQMLFAMVDDTREMPACANAPFNWVSRHCIHWQPQSKEGETLNDWMPYRQADTDTMDPEVEERLKNMEKLQDLFRKCVPFGIFPKHPSTESDFAEKHDLNVLELEKAARQFDEQDVNAEGTLGSDGTGKSCP